MTIDRCLFRQAEHIFRQDQPIGDNDEEISIKRTQAGDRRIIQPRRCFNIELQFFSTRMDSRNPHLHPPP